MSSIGQYTVQTTPLQMAQVAQTIANDGQMMTPYLIGSIVDADNQVVRTTTPTDAGRPISSETASKLRAMMEAVVSQPYGTGTTMALPNVSVAAKTGTAETGEGDHANAWAVGFAPADNPRIAFCPRRGRRYQPHPARRRRGGSDCSGCPGSGAQVNVHA